MSLSRREFLQMLAVASAAGINLETAQAGTGTQRVASSIKANNASSNMYEVPRFGNVSFLHMTDMHAQLKPVYFREPSINLGVGEMEGNAPHLVGDKFLKHFGLEPNTPAAHAFTCIDFAEAAKKYGKVGGYAHLLTLIKHMREQRPGAFLLDGGDNWQGNALALWTDAQSQIDAMKIAKPDFFTSHWEATYTADRMKEGIADLEDSTDCNFVAQNIRDSDFNERVFKPYVIREQNGVKVAVVGQAFPYTPIANPRWMTEGWSFGIRDDEMQEAVDSARDEGAEVVVVLSHNGMDVDIKMASKVTGIDAIMGGHTHDAVPTPTVVKNSSGQTLVCNAGSNAKYLGVLDFDVRNGKVQDYKYHLLPVFADFIEPDKEMAEYIDKLYKQEIEFEGKKFNVGERTGEVLATNDALLYRRGNFTGTWDQLICDALIDVNDAQISFSPGVRWGTSLIPGEPITYDDMMTHVALTYPNVTVNEFTGEQIKDILEDVCDNIFNTDPYYQQGGDMVRVGGMQYACAPNAEKGKRILDMELDGEPIDPKKKYKVAGWASVAEPGNIPGDTEEMIWDQVETWLRDQKHIKPVKPNEPVLKGMEGNPGITKDC
ncbi:MAG: thiosulfohydrolase SoxB [Guyparkeria sp.]|uniref:thiosulfohydrolase SoxB n=1 Tax=Guyparkeria sp. TaxID=2035736 RepID=UPI00397E0971